MIAAILYGSRSALRAVGEFIFSPFILRTAEILMVRGLPGITNLISLLWVAKLLGLKAYGEFSLVVASAGFGASFLFGVISQTIIPRQAAYDRRGLSRQFQKGLLAAGMILATLLGVIAVVAFVESFLLGTGTLICICFGLTQIFQQTFQAKEAFWRYGFVGFTQAIVFAVLVFSQRASSQLDSVEILWPYLVSHCAALFVAYLLSGRPLPARPSRRMYRDFRSVGLGYTAGNLAENCLFLGFRWLLVAFGSPAMLAVFSFAVDLVQRSVSVVINLVGFALIPRAFREIGNSDERRFRLMLMKGGVFGLTLAMGLSLGIVLVASTGQVQALAVPHFVPWVFVVISATAGINRFKKVAIDPIAIQRGRTGAILVGYVIGASIATVTAYFALDQGFGDLVVPIYFGGYVLALMTTAMGTFLSFMPQREMATS